MKHLLSALLLFLFLPVLVRGQQNLVPNGDFEYYTSCPLPNSGLQVQKCTGWKAWVNSPDYMNACYTSSSSGTGVPSNGWGYQNAASGSAYIGGYSYHKYDTNHQFVKEIITRDILPMQIGGVYEVSISVSIADNFQYGGNDFGIYFYDQVSDSFGYIIGLPVIGNDTVKAQVEWPHMTITDKQNWVRLAKNFIADSAYDNIAIGGFRTPANLNYALAGGGAASSIYYYYDSVVVKLVKKFGIKFEDSLLCAGDTVRVPYFLTNTTNHFSSNNVFTLQLSNASGSFSNPINIGTKTSNTSDTITGVIPTSITAGDGYRLRLVSSNNPDTTFPNCIDIKIGTTIPAKPIASNNGPVCSGDTLVLNGYSTTTNVSYKWKGPNNYNSQIQNPMILNPTALNSGDYILTAYNHGCESKDTTSAIVISQINSSGIFAIGNTPVCEYDTLMLTTAIHNTLSYSWTGPNVFSSTLSSPKIQVLNTSYSGKYILTISNGTCSVTDTVNILVKPVPQNLTNNNNSPLCLGESLNFTGSSTSSGVTWNWTGPSGFNSTSSSPFINGATTAQNGDYYVTATLNGCSLSDTLSVTVKPLPAKPVAGNNSPLCAGDSLHLNSSSSTSGVNYSWAGPGSFTSSAQDTSVANSTTTMSGDYIVTADLNGCTRKDTTTVLVKPLPVAVTLSNSGPLCAGDTLHLSSTTSTTGSTYSWSGPGSYSATAQNTNRANSTAGMTGWYKMLVGLNGCTYADSTYATIHPIPAVPNISYTNPLCVGEALNLGTATVSGASYNWSGPGSFSSSAQNPVRSNMQFGDTGSYKLAVTVNGCTSDTAAATVHINPLPFVVIFANPADSICQGDRVNFTALPNNHGGTPAYQWYVNGQATGMGTVFSTTTLNDQDVVRVDMTENTKCSAAYTDPSNDITMNVLPWLAPSVSISVNPNRPLKENEYASFTATATNAGNNPQYQWKRNGQDIVGATGSVWSANALNDNDSISVEIISSYKCPQPPGVHSNGIVVKVLTGVAGMSDINGLVLYPNPNNGKFVLKGEALTGEVLKLEIINAMGQVVYKDGITVDNGKLYKEITLSETPTGIYMLRLSGDETISIIRFSVK